LANSGKGINHRKLRKVKNRPVAGSKRHIPDYAFLVLKMPWRQFKFFSGLFDIFATSIIINYGYK
jgi:hypothetical protein